RLRGPAGDAGRTGADAAVADAPPQVAEQPHRRGAQGTRTGTPRPAGGPGDDASLGGHEITAPGAPEGVGAPNVEPARAAGAGLRGRPREDVEGQEDPRHHGRRATRGT